MKITMNINGYLKLYRYDFLMRLKGLTDQEMRLYLTLVALTKWDRKNKETFGLVHISVRKLKEKYLKKWSIGKIGTIRKSLVTKEFLTPAEGGGYLVENYWIYQATMPRAELAFQCIEQGIQPTEQNVREIEQRPILALEAGKQNLLQRFTNTFPPVQPTEQNREAENEKKEKEDKRIEPSQSI